MTGSEKNIKCTRIYIYLCIAYVVFKLLQFER